MTYRVVIHHPLPPQLQIHLKDRVVLIPPNGVLPVVPLLEPVFLKLHPRDGDAAFEAFAAEHVLPLGGHLLVGHDLGLPVDVPGQPAFGRVGEALEDRIRRRFLRCLRLVCRNERWAMGFGRWCRRGGSTPTAGTAARTGPVPVPVHLQADEQVGGFGSVRRFAGTQQGT